MFSKLIGLRKLLQRESLIEIKASQIIDEKRKEFNEEDLTIVWFSKDSKNVNKQSFIGSLRSINDYIQIFDNEEETLTYMESIEKERILLIIEEFSEYLCQKLKSFKQIEVIFLFTNNISIEYSLSNLIICSTEEQLIDQLKSICQYLHRDIVVFSVYNKENNEKYDLTYEKALQTLPKSSESKILIISKHRNYYFGNEKILKEIHDFEMNYKSTEAIKWFRTDTFIYRLINKALRTEDFNTLYLFQFFIVDLSKQLENEFHKFNKTNKQVTNRILRVYRSLKITQDERKKFEKSIGKLILMNGYLSATYQREITYESIAKQKIRDDEAKVLFEYIIDFNNVKSVMFANISSQYNQSEEINDEILFDLGTTFKINSCKYHEKDQIWLINVIGTDEGTHVATEYIQYQKSKVIHSNIMLMLGHLIIETGNYDKAENYFDAFLHSSVPNDEEIACIYYNIGRIYRLKGEYQRALEFLNRSYISHSHARPARLFSAAKTMNAIGIVCIELKDIPRAVDSFECALRLYGKTVEEHHPDVGGTLINLGNIYSEQAYFDDALSCFQRAQKIYEQNFPANHPNIALLLNNIGNLYYEQKNFHLALDAYQHALKINEKILPAHHSTLVRNKDNLSKVYLSLAELQSDKPPEYTSLNIDTFIEPTSNMEINNVHKLNSN